MSLESDFHGRLGVMRRSFAEQLPGRLVNLEAAFSQWLTSGAETDLAVFQRLAHNLSGSGGTYGFPGVSEAARALEQEINILMATRAVPAAVNNGHVGRSLAAVAKAVAEVQAKLGSEESNLLK